MKKIAKTAVIFMVTFLALVVAPSNKAKAQFGASISIEAFYSELAPYGQWVADPAYGYIWVPDAGRGFRPYYTQGHWVMTMYGSMWVSDYPWGWAPFHYGRWTYNSYYGWVWIPGTEWGPAWVTWRSSDDYCGWAPLGPGLDVSFSFASYTIPDDWWVFLPERYVLYPSFHNYCIPFDRNRTYVRTTSFITNSYNNGNIRYASGPRINDIERTTHSKVPVYNISNLNRPGRTSLQGSSVSTYRPQVAKSFKGNTRQTPPAVITRDQFIKNKDAHNAGVNNNGVGRTRPVNQPQQQIERKPPQFENKQTNDRQMIQEKKLQNNQPVQQAERKQVQPFINKQNNDRQNNNRQIIQEQRKQFQSPVNQPNNTRQVMQEKQMQIRQQPVQTNPRQFEHQNNNNNNNRTNFPPQQIERKPPQQQIERKPPQQNNSSPQQTNPDNKGRGKGHN